MSNNAYDFRPLRENMYGGGENGAYDSHMPYGFSRSFTLRSYSDLSEVAQGPTLWPPFGERITAPVGLTSFPLRSHFPARTLVLDDGIATEASTRPRTFVSLDMQNLRTDGDSMLSEQKQREALKKLKKETYRPKDMYNNSARMISRVGQYYKGNLRNIYEEEKEKSNNREKCVICLEDFESREEIALTPCNHMFHEECIVPWVKRHGKCPVCRFAFCERTQAKGMPLNNTSNSSSDLFSGELSSIIRAMDEAFEWGRFTHY